MDAELDTDRMRHLLEVLDGRLRARGVAASIYVFGGAAVALAHGRAGVTPDVDATFTDLAVAEEARAVALAEGLPDSWLNSAGAGWLPAKPEHARVPPIEPGLTVHLAPPEHLLAMKMVAMRRKDAPDIVILARSIGIEDATAEVFALILRDAYSGENQLADILGVPDHRLDEEVGYISRDVVTILRNASTTG